MSFKKLSVHIICWSLFILYEISITVSLGNWAPWYEFAIFYVLDIAFFYFNAHIVFERTLNKRQNIIIFSLLILYVLIELGVYIVASFSISYAFRTTASSRITLSRITPALIKSVWRGIYFLGLSIGYWFALRTIRSTRLAQTATIQQLETEHEKIRLEKDNVKLQNAYLHAQINPHFLFNSLNFIYNQIEETNPVAANNIVLLADIMRYSLGSQQEDGKVPLSLEIGQIERYIQLNLARFNDLLYLHTEIDEECQQSGKRIPPLLLFTFIENAFKHGDMSDPSVPGLIQIKAQNGWLLFHTSNKKRKRMTNEPEHIGIHNAEIRLASFYNPEDVQLDYRDAGENFLLSLKIKL